MTLLPQLERELLDAHGRLAGRRYRFASAWLRRRARQSLRVPVGLTAGSRTVLGAGLRAAPAFVAVAVTLVVAAGALIVIGHGRHTPRPASPRPPAGGSSPSSLLSPSSRQQREQKYIQIASLQTARQDRRCALRRPTLAFSDGAPSATLRSSLGLLRAAGVRTTVVDSALSHGGPPFLGQVYRRYERLARTESLTATVSAMVVQYYVVAAANVLGAAATPGRCYAEQSAALRRELPQIPQAMRSSTLKLQRQTAGQQRYYDQHAEGISVLVFGGAAPVDMYSATTTQLKQYGATGTGFQWGHHIELSGVVPDGVATVTLYYPAGPAAGPKNARAFSLTAHPIHNLFVVRLPQALSITAPDRTVWRAANGSIIKTILVNPKHGGIG